MIKASDIGHAFKAWDLHLNWSSRVINEFHRQGDEEKKAGLPVSPLCDSRDFNLANSQKGFLTFAAQPMLNLLVDAFPQASFAVELRGNLQANIDKWTEMDHNGEKSILPSLDSQLEVICIGRTGDYLPSHQIGMSNHRQLSPLHSETPTSPISLEPPSASPFAGKRVFLS